MVAFNSSRSAIARSRVLLEQFNVEAKRILSEDFFVFVTEFNFGINLYEWKVRKVKEVPDALSERAWDAMSKLRNALDQAAYEISVASGGKVLAAFPFSKSQKESENKKKDFGNVPDSVFDCMMSFRPYTGGNEELWALHNTNNINKHRYLIPSAVNITEAVNCSIHIPGALIGQFYTPAPRWDYDKGEMVLACFTNPKGINTQVEIMGVVSLAGSELFRGKPVDVVISYYIETVENILFKLEGEAERSGLIL